MLPPMKEIHCIRGINHEIERVSCNFSVADTCIFSIGDTGPILVARTETKSLLGSRKVR